MKTDKKIFNQILSLFFLSLGGWLLHYRVHPIAENPSFYIPFILGLLNIFIVPILFNSKKTSIIAYLINGFSVIVGTILMAHLSLAGLSSPVTVSSIFFRTRLADIILLLPKLFIAQSILNHYHPAGLGRFFTTWWWIKHFCYASAIYCLGYFLWR